MVVFFLLPQPDCVHRSESSQLAAYLCDCTRLLFCTLIPQKDPLEWEPPLEEEKLPPEPELLFSFGL